MYMLHAEMIVAVRRFYVEYGAASTFRWVGGAAMSFFSHCLLMWRVCAEKWRLKFLFQRLKYIHARAARLQVIFSTDYGGFVQCFLLFVLPVNAWTFRGPSHSSVLHLIRVETFRARYVLLSVASGKIGRTKTLTKT